MKNIGFIGLGIMGSRMASHLTNTSNLTVYNRSKEKAESLVQNGATATSSLMEVAKDKDIVFTMLSTPEVVKLVAFGENGFVKHMRPGSLWVDCTTIDPESSLALAKEANLLDVKFLDAPVAGTKQPAERGELVFLVGGEADDVKMVSPTLDLMGKKTIHLGEVSSGTAMKMVVNLMLGQSMQAFAEAAQLGKVLGLETQLVHNVLLNTPVTAPFLQVLQQKIESSDTSANFPLKWMSKDVNLANGIAQKAGLKLPMTKALAATFKIASDQGIADEDFSSIYHYFDKQE